MKFVYFGYDFMIGGVRRLLREGHELAAVFTFPCDNVFNFNEQLLALAQDLQIPVSDARPQPGHIEGLIREGVTCFLSAGYPYKIPPVDETRAYGVNLHPSLLPLGRGIMPTPYIIIDHPEASGLTAHKLTEKFDAGDILHQTPLPLADSETVESLCARIALRAPDVLSMLMRDLPSYWRDARPQNARKATHFPPPPETLRTLDWAEPVRRIDRVARAFGRYGSIAHFDGRRWIVFAHDVWEERHRLAPGTLACALSREAVIAAKDGFVVLKEFQEAR